MALETHHKLGSFPHGCKVPNHQLQETQSVSSLKKLAFELFRALDTYVFLNRFSKADTKEKLALVDLEM